MDLIYEKIFKYLDHETRFDVLKSKSKLSRTALKWIKQIKLQSDFDLYLQLEIYCRDNDLVRLIKVINLFGSKWNWNMGLGCACYGGHRKLVDLMISKGADCWENGLIAASFGGHLKLVNLMIEKGATNWDEGLGGACHGGRRLPRESASGERKRLHVYRELADLMIEKGATDWNWGLTVACYDGHQELVELMILKGATYCDNCLKSIEEHIL